MTIWSIIDFMNMHVFIARKLGILILFMLRVVVSLIHIMKKHLPNVMRKEKGKSLQMVGKLNWAL